MGQSKLKLHKTAADPAPGAPEEDGLSVFATEADKGARNTAPAVKNFWSGKHVPLVAAGFAAVLIAGAAAAVYVANRPGTEPSAAAATPGGIAIIDSRPSGAAILIDGIAQGTTPAKISLTAGRHTLQLKAGGNSRTFTLDMEAATTISHYVELAPAVAPVTTGRLEVASDPPGAQVTINGTSRGRTPVAVADLPPGELMVAIASGQTTVNRRVTITAGNTASVFASLGAPDAAAGWVVIKAPIDLEIFEGKRLVGSTASDRLMMPAGRHDLVLTEGFYKVTGNPMTTPHLTVPWRGPIAVIAGTDISLSASFSNPSSGLYYARHQLDVAGSPVINGQLVALNEADTPYPVTSNQTNNPVRLTGGRMELTGSPTINYGGNGLFAARMLSWRECRDLAPGDPNGPCGAP